MRMYPAYFGITLLWWIIRNKRTHETSICIGRSIPVNHCGTAYQVITQPAHIHISGWTILLPIKVHKPTSAAHFLNALIDVINSGNADATHNVIIANNHHENHVIITICCKLSNAVELQIKTPINQIMIHKASFPGVKCHEFLCGCSLIWCLCSWR